MVTKVTFINKNQYSKEGRQILMGITEMAEYKFITTKCPVLNRRFRESNVSVNTPPLEVIVLFRKTEKKTDNGTKRSIEPYAIMCDDYDTEKGCKHKEGGECMYEKWKPFKK